MGFFEGSFRMKNGPLTILFLWYRIYRKDLVNFRGGPGRKKPSFSQQLIQWRIRVHLVRRKGYPGFTLANAQTTQDSNTQTNQLRRSWWCGYLQKNEKKKKSIGCFKIKVFFDAAFVRFVPLKTLYNPLWSTYKAPSCLKFLSREAESWTIKDKFQLKWVEWIWMVDLKKNWLELCPKKNLLGHTFGKKNATMYDVFLDMQVTNPEWRFKIETASSPPGFSIRCQNHPSNYWNAPWFFVGYYMCHGQKSRFFGDGHLTFNRNPYNGYIKPLLLGWGWWVYPLLYVNVMGV